VVITIKIGSFLRSGIKKFVPSVILRRIFEDCGRAFEELPFNNFIKKKTDLFMKLSIVKSIGALFFVIMLCGIIVTRGYSQARPSSKENVLSADPLDLIFGQLNVQYELKAGPVNSYVARLHYWIPQTNTWSAFGVGAAYRWYIADSRALTGLAVEPAADLYFSSDANGHNAIIIALGGDISYKWIFDDFALEPILGVHFGFSPSSTAFPQATTAYGVLGLNLGYAW
jgi:hypothetical protein